MPHVKMRTLASLLLAAATALLTACTDGGAMMPRSGGRAYEVLVVGDVDSLVSRALHASADGLPTREPMFDVSTASRLDAVTRVARTIVDVTIDRSHPGVQLRYERNVYATPQLLVHVYTPSATALRLFMKDKAALLTGLIESQEMAVEQAALHKKHNKDAEAEVTRMFDASMLVPADLTAMKRGRDFLWLSDNSGAGYRCLCLYRLPKGDFSTLRDSVMRANLPGDGPDVYMQTVTGSLHWQQTADKQYGTVSIARGLWQMRGDAMGGPFVAHIAETGNSTLVAEAFVYAPGTKKRNKLRLLEAALYTLKPKQQKHGK